MQQLPAATTYHGLSEADIPLLRQTYGRNIFRAAHGGRLRHILSGIVREPMFLLLLAACLLYFILGNITEGAMMLAAILLVSAISLYQETKSSRALEALREYTAPKVTVIRNGMEKTIGTEDLVPGDIMLLSEGDLAPADGLILSANDLTVNESIMTGESLPAAKEPGNGNDRLYQGTTINTGKCIAKVTATGNHTALGKLGKAIGTPEAPRTLLQEQIAHAVRRLALFGVIAFLIICVANFIESRNIVSSLLLGLTLAMAAIPEEIPVAFSSFMALGALYMSRLGIISRQPQIIEYLGAASVLCLDKTGTITENRMKVIMVYDHHNGLLTDMEQQSLPAGSSILYYAALASEHPPFDSMEKAIITAWAAQHPGTVLPAMVHEYPLEGRPPMMTHVYPGKDGLLAAAKGAPERIKEVCNIRGAVAAQLRRQVDTMTSRGYRVLGVASAVADNGKLPENQDHFSWRLEGLISLYDPPKPNAAAVIEQLYDAGIQVKLITGDHPGTAMHIAERTGILNSGGIATGSEVMLMDEKQLQETARTISVFARMFPEAKLKVVNALKAGGEIVAMTGDGVNDGLALKAAHIGIAMGKKGTEIARLAADLVITDDNLEKIPEAIRQGRKIYSNLKKAIRYIISIHIPIILTAILPLLLGWKYPLIFTPIHVIFLELIMGPTCSVFFEREPVENTVMQHGARRRTDSLFRTDELLITVVQGLVITGGVLAVYYFSMQQSSLEVTRSMVFTTLLVSNIFLTFANRSFTESIARTIHYRNNLAPVIVTVSVIFLLGVHLVPFIRNLFGLAPIGIKPFLVSVAAGFVSVAWFEVYKAGLARLFNNA